MRHADLKAVGHNIADSLASGIGLMIGLYTMDVFGEASANAPGYLEIDFLRGTTTGSPASPALSRGVTLYSAEALPSLCKKHKVDPKQVKILQARYSVHPVYGPRYLVTVEDQRGKRSVDHFAGYSGRRLRTRP